MYSIGIIIRKIVTSLSTLFRNLKFESNVVILYKSQVINDNCSRANIEVVTYRNLCDVCEYEGNKYIKKYNKFIAQGDLGYYAYLDGRWVHRTWIKIGPGIVNKWSHFPPFRLKAGEAYCHFGETAPMARGQNISAAVLNRAAIDLKGKVDYFYTLVDENNFASRRVQEKAGFIEVKRLKRIHFLWLNFYRELK